MKYVMPEGYYPHWISHFYSNKCEECGKRFPTKASLGQHRKSVHETGHVIVPKSSEDDRPWKCEQCYRSFKTKPRLDSHRDTVHLNLKIHVCAICGDAFKSRSSLRGHMLRHEGRRDYKCEVCHKEYYTYSALRVHKVIHQTARDFICGICGKAFKIKKALKEHETLHTEVKLYSCPICGREIRVKSNWYKHMRVHKKNAELGITSGRGGNRELSRTDNASTSSGSQSQQEESSKTTTSLPKGKGKPKVKQIKVEDRILEINREPSLGSQFLQQSSSGLSNTPVPLLNPTDQGLATSSSPIQGATAVDDDIVLENADLGNDGDHRGPIVFSIVTDGLSGGLEPGSIFQMNPEQQAQLLSAVTSFANSQGRSVTLTGSAIGGGAAIATGPTFLTDHPPVTSTSSSNKTSTETNSASGQDPLLSVGASQL